MITATAYRITATYGDSHDSHDCSTAEVLGDAHGRIYASRDAAEEAAEDLQDDVEDAALDESTSYSVRDVRIEIDGPGERWEPQHDDPAVNAEIMEWEWYGSLAVRIDGAAHEISICVGVPAFLRGSAGAAGGAIHPYLTAWWADSSDHAALGASEREAVLSILIEYAWDIWAAGCEDVGA